MRTTQKTYWSRLTESHSSTYLPSISSHVDAAYDIPAKGVAYIFTGMVMGSLSLRPCQHDMAIFPVEETQFAQITPLCNLSVAVHARGSLSLAALCGMLLFFIVS